MLEGQRPSVMAIAAVDCDDVCWRHIGTPDKGGTEKCYVLYDLADLEKTKGNQPFLISHISTLKRQMGTEGDVESQGFEAIVGNEPVQAIIIVKEPMGKSG
jgi:hypothetical protein